MQSRENHGERRRTTAVRPIAHAAH
jgi:hypothetical protein